VRDAKGDIDSDPLRVLTPGIFIVLIVLCVNFLGDGLRDALDPRATGADSKETQQAKKAATKARKQMQKASAHNAADARADRTSS
jgi:peptide/nickel transport system permease protein